MSTKARRKREEKGRVVAQATPAPDRLERLASGRAVWIFFLVAVLLFYAAPLFEDRASVQWDAADYHYSAQKYFADHVLSGKMPLWTPYPFSGMPFVADPQVGAWYPLNWPFFLIGITPRAIEWEIALHCLLACTGAFLLARELIGDPVAALFVGVLYGFSGFFAAHASHVGMFQSAALLPWLTWTGLAAIRRLLWLPAAGAIAASIILAGYFQSALYALTGFALILVAHGIYVRAARLRIALVLGSSAVMALALTAVQVLPGLELATESIRGSADFSRGANSTLEPGALITLVNPDHYGAPGVEHYTGPQDITQFYFYQGLLLLPLAGIGAVKGKARLYALVPAIPALWYAFGPAAGFYLLVARLPGYRNIRAPVHVWFVIAIALAILAGSGLVWLRNRYPYRWLPVALLAVFCVDLWYWNMGVNELAYARASFQDVYGALQDKFSSVAAKAKTDPFHRLWAPHDSQAFGPLNAMLDSRTEVTYGYNPLELSRYMSYMETANTNPRLLDSLAVTAKLNITNGLFVVNPSALPRVFAPPSVVIVRSKAEAAAKLPTLDPSKEAVVEGPPIFQGGPVQAQIRSYTGSEYRIAYQSAQPALLRIAVPYFPGWRATVGGQAAPVYPVDLALSGVLVPPGNQELVFRYESTWFRTGAWISAVSWFGVAVWFSWVFVARRSRF